MAKVTGLGGVFYVVKNPAATRAWYRDMLGIEGDYGPQLMWSEETGDKPYSLVSHFAGVVAGTLPCPLIIVPGGLAEEALDRLS